MRSSHTLEYVLSVPNMRNFPAYASVCPLLEGANVHQWDNPRTKETKFRIQHSGGFIRAWHWSPCHIGRKYAGVWFLDGHRNMCVVVIVCQVITTQSRRVTPENSSMRPATTVVMVLNPNSPPAQKCAAHSIYCFIYSFVSIRHERAAVGQPRRSFLAMDHP